MNQSRTNSPQKNRGQQLLDGFEQLLDLLGERLPDLGAKIGRIVLVSFDIVAGGIFMSWVVGQLAPAEFRSIGKFFAWSLSAALFFVIWQLYEAPDDTDGWDEKKILAWGLNILDALVLDAGGVFILFGVTGVLQPGLSGLQQAIAQMPIFGWVVYGICVVLSLFAERFRRQAGGVQPKGRSSLSSTQQRPTSSMNQSSSFTQRPASSMNQPASTQYRQPPPASIPRNQPITGPVQSPTSQSQQSSSEPSYHPVGLTQGKDQEGGEGRH
jgi:hypothetical protein